MVAQYPSASNVFVKDHEASGKLTVDFSRNVKDFAINNYAQIQPVTKVAGYYREVTVEEAGRILNSDLANFAWADGAAAPEGFEGTEKHEWKEYRAERYAFPVTLGDLTIDQASWDVRNEYAAKKAQQAMTGRTIKIVDKLLTAANYDATHTAAVATAGVGGARWDAAVTSNQAVKQSLNYAANIILKDTLAGVDINDLILVISPGLAKELSATQELVDHIKGSPDALAQIRGELPGKNAIYGLPEKLYGFPVVVEKTVKVTSRKGATKATSFVMDDNKAVMVSRPGGLLGVFGAPSFATATIFMMEEMTTEVLRDEKDRRTLLRVVENYDVVLTAPVSGFLFTDVLTP